MQHAYIGGVLYDETAVVAAASLVDKAIGSEKISYMWQVKKEKIIITTVIFIISSWYYNWSLSSGI